MSNGDWTYDPFSDMYIDEWGEPVNGGAPSGPEPGTEPDYWSQMYENLGMADLSATLFPQPALAPSDVGLPEPDYWSQMYEDLAMADLSGQLFPQPVVSPSDVGLPGQSIWSKIGNTIKDVLSGVTGGAPSSGVPSSGGVPKTSGAVLSSLLSNPALLLGVGAIGFYLIKKKG